MTFFTILILLILIMFVSTLTTIVGFGTGTIMVPILLTFMPLAHTYLLVGFLQWFSSLWKTWLFWPHVRWHLMVPFGIPAVVGSAIGALTLFQLPPALLYRLFGVVLICYVIFLFVYPNFKLNHRVFRTIVGGLFLGFIGGLFGIRGPIRSAFLTAFDLPKEDYLCTSGVIGLLMDTTRLAIYLMGGMQMPFSLWLSLGILIPISLVAAQCAQKIVKRVPQDSFRHLIAIMLGLVGIKFLLGW